MGDLKLNVSRPYPQDATFGALLDWHLWWGTRPHFNSSTAKSPRWPPIEFAHVIHLRLPGAKSDQTSAKKLRDWRSGRHLPENDTVIEDIYETLFGDDPSLRIWKADLKRALENEWDIKTKATRRQLVPVRTKTRPLTRQSSSHLLAVDSLMVGEIGLHRELLENLALRFEHDNPDESDASLLSFFKRTI